MWEYYGEAVPQVAPEDVEAIAAPIDWLGVNYYERNLTAHDPEAEPPQTRRIIDPALDHTADREVYPEGLYDTLVRVHNDYGFGALYVTENGCALADAPDDNGQVHDPERIRFLEAHLAQAARALEAGVPLKGFFVWSLLDNFEWSMGYTLRYGVAYTNFDTLERTIKDSGYWLRDFIASQRG